MSNILVINDDGINSVGLSTIVDEIKDLGDVTVVTPADERSGIGKALSIGQVNVSNANNLDGITAYSTSGTPADSFLIAINKILKKLPDLLISGINIGPNLGIDDVLTSGTIGAAFEAAIRNVPAIAISYCVSEISDESYGKNNVSMTDLRTAAKIGHKVAKFILENGMPNDVDIISIYVPENADCNNISVTSLCYDGYGDIHTEVKDGYKIKSWALRHYPDGTSGTDLFVIKKNNCISITPIKVKFVHNRKNMKKLLSSLSD